MKFFQWLKYHAPRIRHSLGQRLILGARRYRLRGYHPDRLAYDFKDEPHMLPVLRRVLGSHPGVFIDVGANVGQTLIKVLAADPCRPYVGFEPQVDCCFYIKQFLRRNSLDQLQIIPLALSNGNGLIQLFWDEPYDTTASILPSHAYAPNRQRPHMSWVPARRGDEIIREMEIDEIAAEGYELEVLNGLRETLKTQRPVVLFEVLSNYFWNEHVDKEVGRQKSQRADKIHALLTEAGYAVYQIDGRGDEHLIERFDLDRKPMADLGNEGRDYIARPKG
jgi:FkbM family methyltransferase